MNSLKLVLTNLFGYRGGLGQWSFILHRLTGLGTLLFLGVHILDTSTVYFFPSLYAHAIALYRSTIFEIGEIILVFCVFYHGTNGARIALFDLFLTKEWRTPPALTSARWTLIIAVLLWLPAAFLMVRNILIYNFGL